MAAPDPIPVYPGDDWSFLFAYTEADGTPIDITNATVSGSLFPPFQPASVPLSSLAGLAGIVDGPNGQFGIGVPRDMNGSFVAAKKGAVLHVYLQSVGLLRTRGVFPLLVLDGRDTFPPPLVNLSAIDPVSGNKLTLLGPTEAFPIVGDLTTNFDTEGNPAVTLLG